MKQHFTATALCSVRGFPTVACFWESLPNNSFWGLPCPKKAFSFGERGRGSPAIASILHLPYKIFCSKAYCKFPLLLPGPIPQQWGKSWPIWCFHLISQGRSIQASVEIIQLIWRLLICGLPSQLSRCLSVEVLQVAASRVRKRHCTCILSGSLTNEPEMLTCQKTRQS